MKIVLGGYIVGYPLGGMTWHHLNYLLGLRALGHEVTFLEDGAYLPPFDPVANTYGDPTYGVDYFGNMLESIYGYWLVDSFPWHYRYGAYSAGSVSVDEMRQRLKTADLFIAVSGVTPTEWYDLPSRTLVIDTDPVFTQLRMQTDAPFLDYYRRFTHCATFGRLIGTTDSPLPTHGIEWIPTNQPVDLTYWGTSRISADRLLTTVGKWEHSRDRVVEFAGRSYPSDKSGEYEKVVDLPSRVGMPIEMRMVGLDDLSRERFEQGGWTFGDPLAATISCGAYENWIHGSLGEFTVAKSIYSGIPSGWFSDRSACFLASGRPVITQSSGFEKWIETDGEGLLSFSSLDEAQDAVRSVLRDPAGHGRAARRIAERYFDSRVVLSELIERAMS